MSCIDRILRGDKPADLPVQAPSSKPSSIGVTIPPGLLLVADEVIE
jgi:hypothetical protein